MMKKLTKEMIEEFVSIVSVVSDCETPDTPSKELINSNTPQPPSGPVRPNNIRRPLGRVSSEQSLNTIESMKDKIASFKKKKIFLDFFSFTLSSSITGIIKCII